jgi:hypothetical protein
VPTVVVTTSRFAAVARATLRSQRVPESISLEIKGNPEFVTYDELVTLSQNLIDDIAARLTTDDKSRQA